MTEGRGRTRVVRDTGGGGSCNMNRQILEGGYMPKSPWICYW